MVSALVLLCSASVKLKLAFSNENDAIARAKYICWPEQYNINLETGEVLEGEITKLDVKSLKINERKLEKGTNVNGAPLLRGKYGWPLSDAEIIHKYGVKNPQTGKFCRQTFVVKIKLQVTS